MSHSNCQFAWRLLNAPGRWLRNTLRLAGWLVASALALQAQNHGQHPTGAMAPPDVVPENSFQAQPFLSRELRRVAVLPLACEGGSDLVQGGEAMRPMLLAELIRTREFEVVSVSAPDLRFRTGRSDWTGAEILPVDFLTCLRRVYGCDAVLFSEMTTYHAFAPLAVGWRMKLVDSQTGRILWAVDELFDAAQPGVLSQALYYHDGGQWFLRNEERSWQIANSPSLFGQFAVARSLSTLPNREDRVKVSPPVADEPRGRPADKKSRSPK